MNTHRAIDLASETLVSGANSDAAYTEYQVRNKTINHWPYPHTLINPIFTDAYYSEMLDAFPGDDAFKPLNEFHADRGAVFLTPDRDGEKSDLDHLDEYQRAFWQQFLDFFGSDRFREALLMLLGGPELVTSHYAITRSLIHLSLDRKGYQIHPHTDVARKIVTVLFYLPDIDDRVVRRYGTSVLAERPGQEHLGPHEWERYDTVFTAPFVANSMFAFRVGDRSWHGVEPVQDPIRRRSIQYFVVLNED